MPPPSVRPATPVVEMMPPVVASPNACVAALKSPQVAPPSARAVRFAGSTRTPRIREKSITTPPSQVPNPGTLWPPPRIARSTPFSRPKSPAAMTSPALALRTMTLGCLSIIALYTLRASS